ncbi:MAG: hypothetical protein IID36_10040, partial [Planctomycetes bacterium]|nr:hypothetical protein [Planctomycetota bacterium]
MKHDAVQPVCQPEIRSMLWGAAAVASCASARHLISAIPLHLLVLAVLAFLSARAVPAIAAGAEDRLRERPAVDEPLRHGILLQHPGESALGDRAGGKVAGGHCACPQSECVGPDCFITQSCSMEIVENTAIACQLDGIVVPNGHARCFDLALEGVVGALTVTAVDFGIQEFVPIVATSTDLNINIYEATTCSPASLATSVLVSTDVVTIDATDNFTIVSVAMAAPPTITSGFMVLEVENPIDGTANPGVSEYAFFPGCNGRPGECGDTLIRAVECGIPDWLRVLGDIGFP